jgi:hypothetical protein
MPRVRLRPAIIDDLPHVIGEPLPCRIRAITALLDDRVIGMGGIALPSRGPAIAFVQFAPSRSIRHDAHGAEDHATAGIPEARRYPVSLHRAGLMAMAMIRTSGAKRVVATADADSDVAVRWLKRLGFKPTAAQPIEGKLLFRWDRESEAATTSRFNRSESLEIGAEPTASSAGIG